MADKRFSIWQVIGVVVVALALMGLALGGGVALGYQWGQANGLAAARAQAGSGNGGGGAPSYGRPDLASQPYLGVEFEPVTPELAKAENLSVESGALIRTVVAGGPAETAGIKVGDIVQKVDDQAVDAQHSLRDSVLSHKAGDKVTLAILRGSETLELPVTLGERAALGFPFGPEQMGPGFHFQFQCDPGNCPAPYFDGPQRTPGSSG